MQVSATGPYRSEANGMNEYVSRLGAFRTLFESANEEITRSEFETFSGRLFEQHPGILRVGWIPRIRRKERAEFEAAAIGDGISGYHIKSLVADGSDGSDRSIFPHLFSTEPKTSAVYGLDHGQLPGARIEVSCADRAAMGPVAGKKSF
jgi:hypothetical protein